MLPKTPLHPDRTAEPTLSVVIPVFNEEESTYPLYERLVEALRDTVPWEAIFVDDGSTDRTVSQLEEIIDQDDRVRAVQFRRNSGQTPAMVAGIEHARGKVIVTMDGDLQNDPRDIPRFLEKIDEGYDIVVGWREKRQDALITRKIPSWIANRIIGRITGVSIRDNGCSLKAYRASLIQNVPLYSEMHRFIPAMTSLAGTRIAQIPVRHHARSFGKSKYGLKRIYKVILDLIVVKTLLSTVSSPLRFFAWLAMVPIAISAGFLATLAVQSMLGHPILIFLGMSLLWGATATFSLLIGLLAELLVRTSLYKESQLVKLTAHVEH